MAPLFRARREAGAALAKAATRATPAGRLWRRAGGLRHTVAVLLVADGNNLAWAGFHALRKAMGAETAEELTRAALLGLTQSVLGFAARRGEPPLPGRPEGAPETASGTFVSRLAVAFDEGRPLRRRSVFPGYQMGREATPAFTENEPFVLAAIDQFIELAAMLPVEVARGTNTEADDLIACLVLATEMPARIASTDRDFLQLVDGRTSIFSPVKRVVIDVANFDEAVAPRRSDGSAVRFPRERYLQYRVASGDASDNLPGIPGVGALTAAQLIAAADLDAYFEQPMLVTRALGRRNVKLEGALREPATRAVVARNLELMDLRLAAARYDSLDGFVQCGSWDEAGFRAWVKDQRIAALDLEAVCRVLDGIAVGAPRGQGELPLGQG